jgi:hypothetical protein
MPIAACGEARGPEGGTSLHPVSGRVMVGGRPAQGVEVRLYPLNRYHDTDAPRPEATTDKDGRFRLRTGGDREGAPNGQYVATLVWPGPGGTDRLGGTFAEPGGSGLTALIEDQTRELPPFEIGSAAVQKPAPR